MKMEKTENSFVNYNGQHFWNTDVVKNKTNGRPLPTSCLLLQLILM